MTCNPDWPEIRSRLRPGQDYTDIPIVVIRVFKQKLAALLKTLNKMFTNVGKAKYTIHVVEFQKRGLPHAHILIKYMHDCLLPSDIDKVISAEIPENEADAYLIRKFMLHKHPAPPATSSYCRWDFPTLSISV
ncbi:hypothetical protein CPC08DRAFT_735572 [Agrocybe pediades]|nr:hypothetical protein CPC08DRAFT_735572 [Agrocybe pediades]